MKVNLKEKVMQNLNELDELIDIKLIKKEYDTNYRRFCILNCKKHGEYQTPVYKYLKGQRCPQCAKEKDILGMDVYKKRYEEILLPEHELLNITKNEKRGENGIIGEIKCSKCGRIFKRDLCSYRTVKNKCKVNNNIERSSKKAIYNNLSDDNIEIIEELSNGYLIRFKCGHGNKIVVNQSKVKPECGVCKMRDKWIEQLNKQKEYGVTVNGVFVDKNIWYAKLSCKKHGSFSTTLKKDYNKTYCEKCLKNVDEQ